MWKFAIGFWRRLMRQTDWHQSDIDGRFVWRRWTPDGWEYREMTKEEAEDAYFYWCTR